MPDPRILAANLEVLARRDPRLALAVGAASAPAGLDAVLSRTGAPVPRMDRGGRPMPLHSTVDPLREAERAAASSAPAAYRVCLGLGGGYHLPFLLAAPGTERLLVVESDPGMLRGFLGLVDMRVPLADPRLAILAEPRPELVASALLEDYLPAAYGSFATFSLRARVDADPDHFSAFMRAIQSALDQAARDYTVQSRFGWRWLRNTLANLRAQEARGTPFARLDDEARPRPERVLVTGAGPSLDTQIGRIRELARDSYLLATDASLAPLAGAGILPDAVISVDCQHVIYHHFFAGLPARCRLVLDLASPPLLARLGRAPVYVATSHPLSRYFAARGLHLAEVDATGGNVSHAAVSLARKMRPDEIRLFGVDLSYPSGKPYARGCFLYPALDARSSRLSPLQSAVTSFVLASPTTRRVSAPAGFALLTEPMAAYRRHLEALAASPGARVVQEPGGGPPLVLGVPPSGHRSGSEPPPQGETSRIAAVLAGYLRELDDLPAPAGPFAAYVQSLSRERRETLATLLPVVAAYQAAHGFPGMNAAFAEVRESVRRAVMAAPPV